MHLKLYVTKILKILLTLKRVFALLETKI